jgi:hypothetical protein
MAKATLDRLDQKLDDLKELVLETTKTVKEQNSRIYSLERGRAYLLGIGTAISAAMSTLSIIAYRVFK